MRSHTFPSRALRICTASLAAAALLAGAAAAQAAELGRAAVLSTTGERLLARIEINGLAPGEGDRVTARLATPGAFARAGIELDPVVERLRFGIETLANRHYVRIWSVAPVTRRELQLVVVLEWNTGRDLRTYRLILESPLPPALERPGSSAPPSAAPAPAAGRDAPRPIPLAVFVNGARAGDWVLLDVNGVLHATDEALQEWRVVRSPEVPGVPFQGQLWYPLSAIPGFTAQFNGAEQSLALNFTPSAFAATRIGPAAPARLAVTPPLTSFFANYDLSYTHTRLRDAPALKDLGALTELGLSGRAGVLTTTHVGRNLTGEDTGVPRGWLRLETTFTRDFPERNASLRLGDSATRTGAWGRSVYFGGVQWASNFALTPGFITQPLPVIAGQSSAPSTVELYINDALRQTSQVPSGPFTIDNLPQITGSGQARIVVRDVLGRETVLVQDFFTHGALLRQGLSEWSAEAGAVRRDLGIANSNYGQRFASGLWRYGATQGLTLETRGEAGEDTRGAGLGFTFALPGQMLGQLAAAASRERVAGSGRHWLASLEHASLRHGFTLRTEGASREYRQIGQDSDTLPYRRQSLASYTYSTPEIGQLGLGHARIDTFDQGTLKTYSANYSMRIGRSSSLTFSATRVEGAARADSVGVSLLIPLDNRVSTVASATRREDQTDSYVGASKGLGVEAGAAWRVLAGRRAGQNYGEGGLYYQGSHGLVTADVSAAEPQQTARLGAQGGLVLADGRLFASRRVQDSFALVEVAGYPDVGVGFQSSVLARTDESGVALIPRLLAYRANSIRLDPNELPINAELDTIEMVVSPPARSGVKVIFPVRTGRGALIAIVLDDGAAAPAGAEVLLEGDPKEFFVARRGEAFVTGLQQANRLKLRWAGQECTIDVSLPPGANDEIPRVGPVLCAGVKR